MRRAQHAGTAPAAQGLTGRERGAGRQRRPGWRSGRGTHRSALAGRVFHCSVKTPPPGGSVRGPFSPAAKKRHDFPVAERGSRSASSARLPGGVGGKAGSMAATGVAARTEAVSPAGGGKGNGGGSESGGGCAAGLRVSGAGGGLFGSPLCAAERRGRAAHGGSCSAGRGGPCPGRRPGVRTTSPERLRGPWCGGARLGGGGRARRGALHPAEARAPEERFACSPVEGGPGVEIRPLFSCSGGQGGLGRQLLL